MTDLVTALRDFNKDRKFNRKGPLCVALVVTQHARKGLPLNPDELLTEAGGRWRPKAGRRRTMISIATENWR